MEKYMHTTYSSTRVVKYMFLLWPTARRSHEVEVHAVVGWLKCWLSQNKSFFTCMCPASSMLWTQKKHLCWSVMLLLCWNSTTLQLPITWNPNPSFGSICMQTGSWLEAQAVFLVSMVSVDVSKSEVRCECAQGAVPDRSQGLPANALVFVATVYTHELLETTGLHATFTVHIKVVSPWCTNLQRCVNLLLVCAMLCVFDSYKINTCTSSCAWV